MEQTAIAASGLAAATRHLARAEAVLWSTILVWYRSQMETLKSSGPRRMLDENAIVLDIALETGLSESQVRRRLHAAETLCDQLPHVWQAFGRGDLDAARSLAIADTARRLERDTSVRRLDATVVGYGTTHNISEVRRWLKRFVDRTEPDLVADRAEGERDRRNVSVEHVEDSMAYLVAYLPSHVAGAIKARLRHAAKLMVNDPRTIAQREADLLASWMTQHDDGTTGLRSDIAVTVSAESLAGVNDDPAWSSDGEWSIPVAWIRELIGSGDTFWHRIVTDSAGGVLDHTYLGYQTPEILNVALSYRDGVCRSPGCIKPATECDNDHVIPFPHGPTAGWNLHKLCRRHHGMKGHGINVVTPLERRIRVLLGAA